MILSHRHTFIVFKTRKTGGTSFEIALSRYMGAGDVVTPIAPDDEKIRASLGFTGPQNHELAAAGAVGLVQRFYNHIGAGEVRSLLPDRVFGSYVKAAIVRNPFDFAVSWYFWERSRSAPTSRDDFRHWLRAQFLLRPALEAEYRQRRRPNPGMFSANRFITHIEGNCVMDVMLRYEHFQEDVERFAKRVGLPDTLGQDFRAIRAKGNYRPASATAPSMFEGFADGQQMIREVFAEEIDTYGYALS